MKNLAVSLILLLLLLVGCASSQSAPTQVMSIPTLPPATLAPESTAVANVEEETQLEEPVPTPMPATVSALPLPTERGEFFSGSGTCAICHTNMVDESGVDVSIDTFWRSTMMANAARDPYWQASVRREVLDHPDYRAIIEDKCATCHMPMARFSVAALGGEGKVLDEGFLDAAHEDHALAIDGVSCTLCHQIEETDFGEIASFSGGFVVDTDLPAGERLNYGPFLMEESQAAVMQIASGFIPIQSAHIKQSEQCATCHTLYTPYVDAEGQIAGEFPEQTPYLEWLNSDYQGLQACQDCHMPVADGAVQLSITGGIPRSPFAKHFFVGGNIYMLNVLSVFGEEREVTASSEHFGATIERVTEQLQNRVATVAVEDSGLSGTQLRTIVSVRSLVGHKFPTGFPSRRTWLHVTVQDADGEMVFESGAVDTDGSIIGNDNDVDPAKYEPHYQAIVSPDQVQIYEAIIQNTEGEVTTGLLRAAAYAKDNRILPLGFSKPDAAGDVAVYGEAATDDDFLGGEDRVEYSVELGNAHRPFSVTVELLYQSVGYRWAQNMGQHDALEIARFLNYYQAVPNLPVVVATTTVVVGSV